MLRAVLFDYGLTLVSFDFPRAELLATDDRFAPALISQVKKAVIDDLDGQAGWRVVSVNQNGAMDIPFRKPAGSKEPIANLRDGEEAGWRRFRSIGRGWIAAGQAALRHNYGHQSR